MILNRLPKGHLFFFPLTLFVSTILSTIIPGTIPILTLISGLLLIGYSSFLFSKIISILFERKDNFFETLTLSICGLFFFFPLLLQIIFLATGRITIFDSLITLAIPFFVYAGILVRKKNHQPTQNTSPFLTEEINRDFLYFFIFAGVLFSALVFSYQTLPDLDPYSWVKWYESSFSEHILFPLSTRPFFSGITYLFTSILGISVFNFFKYILPFFALSIIFPAFLMIPKIEDRLSRYIFLFFLFASPSTLLYFITPMPQTTMILAAFYFCLLIIASRENNDSFYFYLAGIISLFSFFYHQIGAILFAIWFAIELFSYRKILLNDRKNFLIAILAFIILWDKILKEIATFLLSWIELFSRSTMERIDYFNFSFPAHYTNIDGISMGWPGMIGVVKYYGYYVGPLIISFLFLYFFLWKKEFKKNLIDSLKNKHSIILLLIFFIFFSIAEIFPRFPGISILPDRAWIFTGIFFVPFIFQYCVTNEQIKVNIRRYIFIFFACTFLIGITGALYINFLKRYTITPSQLDSATWINSHLPEKRVFYSVGNGNLLEYHTRSSLVSINSHQFCSLDELTQIIRQNTKSEISKNNDALPVVSIAKEIQEKINHLKISEDNEAEIKNVLTDIVQVSNTVLEKNDSSVPLAKEKGVDVSFFKELSSSDDNSLNNTNKYVYFSKIDSRNPYLNRSYDASSSWGANDCPGILSLNTSPRFQNIYDSGDVIIWKYLP